MMDVRWSVEWKGWAAIALVSAVLAGIGCWFGFASENGAVGQGGVVVVQGASRTGIPAPVQPYPDPAAQAAGRSIGRLDDSGRVAAMIGVGYPMLKNPSFACSVGRCELTAEMVPAASDAEIDRRQEMLLGGLERLLTTSNHHMAAAIQMDEIGDDEYRIKVITD